MKNHFSILVVLAIGALVVGCAPVTPEPQNPGEIMMTMAAQKVDAEATQMRLGIQYTATAQVVEATRIVESTQVAAAVTEQFRQDAAATDAQGRQDAAATEQSRRRDAAATEQRIRDDEATQQARRDIEATAEQSRQNVLGTATAQMAAIWNGATLAVAPTHDYMTLQAAYVAQTQAAYESELKGLDVEQQSQKNTAEWVVPLLLVLVIVLVFAVVQIRKSRVREIEKNKETGEADGFLLDNKTYVKIGLLPGPIVELGADEVTVPDVTDKETQREVTRRAQAVEALTAMPTQTPTAMATGLMNSVFSQGQKALPIEVVSPDEVRPWVDDVRRQADEEES